MSDNLDLTQVTAAQNNKETTINGQSGELDAAITEVLTVPVDDSNAATIAKTDLQRAVNIVVSDGSPVPTAAITLTVDTAFKRGVFAVDNQTSYAATVTISGQSRTAPSIDANSIGLVMLDGTDVVGL